MSEPDVSVDTAYGIPAIDVFSYGFVLGEKSVMHIIDGILFSSTSDREAVDEIEKYAHEFWTGGAE